MLDTLKAGQTIRCTVVKAPRSAGATKTIERLMRQDPENSKALRRAQDHRRSTMRTKRRGGRTWYQRAHPGRVVWATAGSSWTMALAPQIVADLRSVQPFLKIEQA